MAAVPAPIRSPAPASTRATRTAPARRCGRCSSRSKNGSRDGVAPPASRVPRIARRHRWSRPTASGCRRCPVSRTPPGVNRIAAPVDWVDPPARLDNFYGARVSAVDADGNEIAGIRLPPIAVPLGTYTGWNVYRAQPCELCDRDGSLIPFARTREEARRPATRAPRSKSATAAATAYVAKVRQAAAVLVAERLLLPSDAEAYVRKAESCDWF